MKISIVLLALILLAGCGSARRGAPLQTAFEPADAQIAGGERAFMRYCNGCHPGGRGGLGFAINNKPLPGFLIRFQVRNGLGVMPSFSPEVISPDELDGIVEYLVALRRHER